MSIVQGELGQVEAQDAERPRVSWYLGDIGPRQAKAVKQAISDLRSEGRTRIQLTGVIGDEASEHRVRLWSTMTPPRTEVDEAEQAVIRRFGPVTAANHKDVIAALEAATRAARESTPIDDQRITAEEEAERSAAMAKRNAEQAASSAAIRAAWDAVVAKAPAGAQAVIVATEQQDKSDPMTDYFSSQSVRAVAIGWRFSKREDFAALRAAAATFEPTAALATKTAERRDNYSMGAGNYLGQNPKWGSGWCVKSYPLDTTYPPRVPVEDHLPEPRATGGVASVEHASGVTISPSSLGRAGVVEVRFAEKPAEEVRAALKAAGFRWARGNACWYGPESRLPSELAS
jgi:hypothetical protein